MEVSNLFKIIFESEAEVVRNKTLFADTQPPRWIRARIKDGNRPTMLCFTVGLLLQPSVTEIIMKKHKIKAHRT